MTGADAAGAGKAGEVANADHGVSHSVSPLKDLLKKGGLVVFQVTPQRVTAQIRNLDHTRQLAIHEKWRFYQGAYTGP